MSFLRRGCRRNTPTDSPQRSFPGGEWGGVFGFLLGSILLFGGVTVGPATAEASVSWGLGDSFSLGQPAGLEDSAHRFARAWVNGDLRALEPMLSPGGIRLHIQGDPYTAVSVPRALGALRVFRDRYPGGEAELIRVSLGSGGETDGFADFEWRTAVAGTGEVVIFTLFVALAAEDGIWTVTEIRVLP